MLHINKGTCSRAVEFEVEDGIITQCQFIGGCMGNTTGVARLVVGRPVDEVIGLLSGIDCNGRGTSCPDQLAHGLMDYKAQKEGAQP